MGTCDHPTDKELRLSAMDMAIRLGTYGTTFPDMIDRAKQIYDFLTNKEPEQNG